MKRSAQKEVSAFDAKTHLSSLLRNVEEGSTYTITRRGKPVARLEPVGKSQAQIDELVEGFRAVRSHAKGKGNIRAMIEEGRNY